MLSGFLISLYQHFASAASIAATGQTEEKSTHGKFCFQCVLFDL
jgi:hypothetical protein